jgi:hypothetical protein
MHFAGVNEMGARIRHRSDGSGETFSNRDGRVRGIGSFILDDAE